MKKLLIICSVTFGLLVGCSNEAEKTNSFVSDEASSTQRISVVVTTTMLDDLLTIIGGEFVDVYGLCSTGVDPHTYEPTFNDSTMMNNAQVVVYNGFHLEAKMGQIMDSLATNGVLVICLDDGVPTQQSLLIYNEDGELDPHIWWNTEIWMEAATYIANELSLFDVQNETVYQSNLQNYLIELEALDEYIKVRTQELPEAQRVLITAHDAFSYFGDYYNFDVYAIQGVSTEAEASTSDINELATFIAENKIKAIFTESSVNDKSIQALQEAVAAQGFTVQICEKELYSDSLGDASNGLDNYINTAKLNIDTIVDALK